MTSRELYEIRGRLIEDARNLLAEMRDDGILPAEERMEQARAWAALITESTNLALSDPDDELYCQVLNDITIQLV